MHILEPSTYHVIPKPQDHRLYIVHLIIKNNQDFAQLIRE